MKSLPNILFMMVIAAMSMTANLARAGNLSRPCTVWYVGTNNCYAIAEETFAIGSEEDCIAKAKVAAEKIGMYVDRTPSWGFFTVDMVLSCTDLRLEVKSVRYRYQSYQELR
jgi:hypothetical protein